MSMHYVNPEYASDPHKLPDVEVWYTQKIDEKSGFYYAYGFPGCLHDSNPIGPFTTEQEALDDAREGYNDE
jgi:hypothetical protein